MKNVYREVEICGRVCNILVGAYPDQDDSYYDAMDRGDYYAAHMLHLPYVARPIEMVNSEIKMKQLQFELEDELARIEKMCPNLLRVEIESRISRR